VSDPELIQKLGIFPGEGHPSRCVLANTVIQGSHLSRGGWAQRCPRIGRPSGLARLIEPSLTGKGTSQSYSWPHPASSAQSLRAL